LEMVSARHFLASSYNGGNILEKQFDLIFMDIHMPVMDGLEAASEIMTIEPEIPIVAMTANVMSEDKNAYKASGMMDVLGKPFSSQDLWQCLTQYITPVKMVQENSTKLKQSDIDLRRLLINTFVASNKDKYAEIVAAIEADDIKLAHRLVHTLKSNAGQLNLDYLRQITIDVENNLKSGENLTTPEQMSALDNALNSALSDFEPLIKDSDSDVLPTESSDTEQSRVLLDKLEPMLKDSDFDCLSLTDELRSIQGSEVLIENIENLDFKLALEELTKLRG